MPTRCHDEPWMEIAIHKTAHDFLTATWPSICRREAVANTILPHAFDILALEDTVLDPDTVSHADPPTRVSKRVGHAHNSASQFWLTCWSLRGGAQPVLDLVLSCTSGFFGNFPIFLYSNVPHLHTTRAFLTPRIRTLIESLLNIVPVTRVFSVFGPSPLVKNFSRQWSHITGQVQELEPLYAAKFLFATRETLTVSPPLPPGDRTRRATLPDMHAVGQLLKEFADSSVDYPLSHEQGLQEAMTLILRRQIWVYETGEGQIPSVVAVTRSSPTVVAITKVYTTPSGRNRGYAERLVRKVTCEQLCNTGKQRVVLYVSHGNPAAKVYHRVGFTSLERGDALDDGDEWLEIGFQKTHQGHW